MKVARAKPILLFDYNMGSIEPPVNVIEDAMRLTVNGEDLEFKDSLTISQLLEVLGIDARKVALERNLEIVPRSSYTDTEVVDGDRIEVVHFIGGGNGIEDIGSIPSVDDPFVVAGRRFRSRLIVGTGRYKDFEETKLAIEASGTEIVTVAVRRVNVTNPDQPMLVDFVDPKLYTYLPNTAGCYTAKEALRTLCLAREAGGWELVKLEVLGDEKTLYPDMIETLDATKSLVKEGFDVMVYCTDDPLFAKRLEDAGAAAIMPLGAPIGSGLGLQNPVNIRLIIEQSSVPVLVDAGVGTASDAALAMELGCDGVLVNSAIAHAGNPVAMARAMKLAIESGRLAHKSGRMPRKFLADPSSPIGGLIL